MAKKLVYNYTFTPGAANVGKVVIKGNYPSKVWQLVTVTGTGGLYPHEFVRDEFASTTGAIEIVSGGTGDLTMANTTTFNENTGVITVKTTAAHSLSTGATIRFRLLGHTYTCAKDNHLTEHSYPRTTDPTYGQALPITVTDTTTFTVDVGRPDGGAISSDNEIIYNFADSTMGGSTYYNSTLDETTLTFKKSTAHLDPLDDLQIFIDIQEDKVDFSETFTDPVSKLRVSNPQNLIDTDFEYGLQPTKWETIELVNNVPSFFADTSNYSISDVSSVTTLTGSENITVTTGSDHGLTVGSPIDVQGLTSRTAEGKYLVTSVISTTQFVYKAKSAQVSNATINGSYTVITPGEFYSGSDINIKPEIGVETDGSNPSTLNIETDYHHGFAKGSSVYLTNTIGSKKLTISDTSTNTAPDGRPFVDYENTLALTGNATSGFTETRQMTGTYAHKFDTTSVNTANNTINWPSHGLEAGDALLYSKPQGDSEIGGLDEFQIYYVKSAPTADTITLCETTSGDFTNNAEINFSSTGTSNFGRHTLLLCYEIERAYLGSRSYYVYWYTRYNRSGSGSGRDMANFGSQTDTNGNTGYFGLSARKPDRYLFCRKSNTAIHTYHIYNASSGGHYFGPAKDSNFVFGSTTDGYNFLEDFERWNDTSGYPARSTGLNHTNHTYNTYGIRTYLTSPYYSQAYGQNYSKGDVFFIPLIEDPERDSLYVANHGFEDGSEATVTRNTGSDITYRTDTSKVYNVTPTNATYASGTTSRITVLSNNRIRLNAASRLRTASGTYTITGSKTNTTANSFYFNTHDLSDGEVLTMTASALPTSSVGAIQPDTQSVSASTLNIVYDFTKAALDSVRTTMGADATTMVMGGSGADDYYPFRNTSYTFDGGNQRIYWYVRYLYAAFTGGPSGQSSADFYNQLGDWATGKAFDPFASNSLLAGKGYYYIQTPFVNNTNVPYHISITQVPDPSDIGATSNAVYWSNKASYNYRRTGTYGNETNTYSGWNTSIGNGWEYTYESSYFSPDASYHGHICLYIVLSNTNWTGHVNNWTTSNLSTAYNIRYTSTRYLHPSTTAGYSGTRYQIEVILPIKSGTTASRYGTSGSVKTMAQIANDIATSVSNALTNPDLSAAGGTVYAKNINSNRFALQNTAGVTYDITSSGTSPYTFETAVKTGGLDNYINIDTATDTTLGHFSPTEVPRRRIIVPAADIVSINNSIYINEDDCKLKTPQKLVYSESGGQIPVTTGGALTDGTTYYAISDGPNHFKLASSAADALTGTEISIGTTSTGTFTFTVPSIAGISSATGTIGLTSTSATVEGTGTLFKRFFRTGDTFTIANEDTPPAYQDFTVASVIDDQELTLTDPPGIDLVDGLHYVETKVNTRPDGTFIHRPFDGGVEITAGTSPNSSIVRQTRKYFRYQSGKGIQCSVAINFSPSRIINNIVGTDNTTLSTKTYVVRVNANGSTSYNLSGDDRDGRVLDSNASVTIMKGDTVNFTVNASGHPFWIKDTSGTGTGNAVTTGITNNGTASGTVTWDTTSVSAGTYYYNCENHATMAGTIIVEPVGVTTSIARATTKYPHGLTRSSSITIRGASDTSYNGTYQLQAADDFTFDYYPGNFTSSVPDGIIEYSVDQWTNSAVRTGLFDYQNGMFFEYDGSTLYAVRRSSVQQLTGTVSVQKDSNVISGTDTNLTGQLNIGDFVVIRGMSYRVTNLRSKTEMHIQPAYRGVTTTGIIVTKTIDTKVPQDEWNIDKADGSGPSGFNLDITKIQMAYIDYSWYGAGKIRFGFKDANGHVKYMHAFLHNNRLEEAYMRSGNIPARYEIENVNNAIPSFVPSLFHWGTSVIMDGRFDDDKAYLFTAPSNSLSFTNGDSSSATANTNSSLIYQWNWTNRNYDWYTQIRFPSTDGSKFSTGTKLYTNDLSLNGEEVTSSFYSGSNVFVRVYAGTTNSRNTAPAIYPTVSNAEVVYIGAPSSGGDNVNLQEEVPLISIRLAPSVDNNLTGSLGQREIINRMQLQLKQLGITLSHDCTVDLILNGAISNRSFENVTSPSLSELVKHNAGDKVIGGTVIFSLRASGGTEDSNGKRLSNTTEFDISQITDLGNAINGGDGAFPNGPDLLTIAIHPVDTSEINATSPLAVSSRITWTESQA